MTDSERRSRSGGRPNNLAPIPESLFPETVREWVLANRCTPDPYLPVTRENVTEAWKDIYLLLADRFGVDVDGDPFLKFNLIDWLHYRYPPVVGVPHAPDDDDPEWAVKMEQTIRMHFVNLAVLQDTARNLQIEVEDLTDRLLKKPGRGK